MAMRLLPTTRNAKHSIRRYSNTHPSVHSAAPETAAISCEQQRHQNHEQQHEQQSTCTCRSHAAHARMIFVLCYIMQEGHGSVRFVSVPAFSKINRFGSVRFGNVFVPVRRSSACIFRTHRGSVRFGSVRPVRFDFSFLLDNVYVCSTILYFTVVCRALRVEVNREWEGHLATELSPSVQNAMPEGDSETTGNKVEQAQQLYVGPCIWFGRVTSTMHRLSMSITPMGRELRAQLCVFNDLLQSCLRHVLCSLERLGLQCTVHVASPMPT